MIYRWVNKLNNKSYVGSTVNFYSRFYKYFNVRTLNTLETPIYNALAKYGLDNFRLEIIEYCDRKNILEREQYYLNLLKPEYNILKVAGSSIGFKHNEKTLDYFKNVRKISEEAKHKLSLAASKRTLTELEKKKLSDTRIGIKLSDITRQKISESMIARVGVSVIVKDMDTNTEKTYYDMTTAAKELGVSRTAIKKSCIKGSILKGKYSLRIK